MATIFVVEDDFHVERMGQFPDRRRADAFLERLKKGSVNAGELSAIA